MSLTGVGAIPGVPLMAIGIDQILTGGMNLRYGRVNQGFSVLEYGAYRATGSKTVAFLAPGVLSAGLGSVGSIGRVLIAGGIGGCD